MSRIDHFRTRIVEITIELVKPLVSLFYHPPKWPYSLDSLREFPIGSLGYEVARYLDKMGFGLLNNYEPHDIRHVLFGYEMNGPDEMRLQFFQLGNRNYSFPVWTTTAFGLVLMPEKIRIFYSDFLRGRKAEKTADLPFHEIVFEPLAQIQHRLNIIPFTKN